MIKTIKCDQCDGSGTVLIGKDGSIVDAPLFAPLLERVTCDDCDGSGLVEDESAEYKFEELSEQAKENARDLYRELDSSDDYDCTIEDAVRMAELMGIEISSRSWTNSYGFKGSSPEIFWSGFGSQGDGASFQGNYAYRKGALKALRAECPAQYERDGEIKQSKGNAELHRIAGELQRAQAKHFYGISTSITQSGNYSHSNTMRFEHSFTHPRTGDTEDYYESDATEAIEQALKDFADRIYSQLEAEYDYHNSDEYIDEAIIANEYDFDVEGDRI